MDREKPIVVVSNCLGFCECRYNGQTIPDRFVEGLEPFVNYIKICPEVDIGLGVPRESVRLILDNGKYELYQPGSGLIHTEKMDNYARDFLGKLQRVDGFILKGRSPSCGIKDVKVYYGREKGVGSEKSIGRFAFHVYNYFPHKAIEEEGRLTNLNIREHFLTRLYTLHRFSFVKEEAKFSKLVDFHADHKYLIMAYNQSKLKELGKIVANHEKKQTKVVIDEYESILETVFDTLPRYTNYINTLMHMMGYFKKELSKKEKEFILGSFQKFKDGKIHLSVPVNLLKGYAIAKDEQYLLRQLIWNPFPEELLDIKDSGNR